MSSVKALAEACVPREEVLSGEIRDEMFAARLSDVTQGKAHPVYQDPEQFFANTYPTERMRSFLREVMGRLSGVDKTASALFRLDTPFGGGKTHALIALYHLATCRLPEDTLHRLGVSEDVLLSDRVKVVAVVGDDLDPANGVQKEGDVRVHHLWGEIAYQLGGAAGYEIVRRSDEQGSAPGPQFLEKLVADHPTLILIDEPALYMRKMQRTAGQLPAFLKTLTEWVTTSASRTVLVLTLAWNPEQKRPTGDAFAEENRALVEALEHVFAEVTSVASRPAKVVTPAQAVDIAPILRQRLFQQVDMTAASSIAEAYSQSLRQASDRGTPLPMSAVQVSYREALERSYPFHPSLIEVLDGKLATIPNFQRTRGALRLLTRVIRRLWHERQPDELLIHPFSVDLSDPDIVDELSGRLDRPAFRSVVTYDIADTGVRSHAQATDEERFADHLRYTQRIATTIFLHSLTEPPARGIDLDELLLTTLCPSSDPAHLQKALQYLQDEAWHLDFEASTYFFRTEPSLNKIVIDETAQLPLHESRAEVDRRIRQLWRDAGLEVEYFPDEPSQLDDEAKGRLVIVHWDTAAFRQADKGVPGNVRELWEYAGVQRGYRRFRNTLFFLLADADRCERMVQQARRWLALDRLLRDSSKLDAYKLSREHRQRLDTWRKEANLEARVAITRAYCHLFYPVGETDSAYKPFAHHTLQVEDQGDTRANHTERALGRLRELDKVKSADDAPLASSWIRQNVFGKGENSAAMQSLFERFAERVRLPLLLEPTYLKEIVRIGIRAKEWLYYDQDANLAYDTDQDLPDIVIDERHEVVLPQEAKARGMPIHRRERPEREAEERKRIREQPGLFDEKKTTLEVEGEPRRALSDLIALAKDASWGAIGSLNLRWQGDGTDVQPRLSGIRTVLGQLPRAKIQVDLSVACRHDDGSSWQTVFKGPVGRYQSLASTLENLAGQAQEANASIGLTLEFTGGLAVEDADFEDLRDVFELAGLGRTKFVAHLFEGRSA